MDKMADILSLKVLCVLIFVTQQMFQW